MKKYGPLRIALILGCLFALGIACGGDDDDSGDDDSGDDDFGDDDGPAEREDDAIQVDAAAEGSLQNPAFSPENDLLVFTEFRGGYNQGPADVRVVDLADGETWTLVSDGSDNVNLPGSCWSVLRGEIVFSSSRDPHDEIYAIGEDGGPGDEIRLTERENEVAYEPSFSPDGDWIVFESHPLDVEDEGAVVRYRTDGTGGYERLTSEGRDCRQPNWSPNGESIVYQCLENGRWDLWTMDPDGASARKITDGEGDKTDASFSPDGDRIVFSSDFGDLEFANLFVINTGGGEPERVTFYDGYDGAPSWSADGERIAFESYPGDPDDSDGTTLWFIPAP